MTDQINIDDLIVVQAQEGDEMRIVKKSEVKTCFLHETYDQWGDRVNPGDAGAYKKILTKKAARAINAWVKAYKKEDPDFTLSQDLLGTSQKVEVGAHVYAYNDSVLYDTIETLGLNDEEEGYETGGELVDCIEYWDGNEWQTVIIKAEYAEPAWTRLHEKQEREVLEDYAQKWFVREDEQAVLHYQSKKYSYVKSPWKNWGVAAIDLISEI